jgi:hypothetical protein
MSGFNHRRPGTPLSRRQAIAVAATVGVGLTAGTAIGVASAGEIDWPGGNEKGNAPGVDIFVRVRDLSAGTLEVFTGERSFEVRDRDLAKRLAKAATAARKKG